MKKIFALVLAMMMVLTLAACAADAVFCLQELRVPICACFNSFTAIEILRIKVKRLINKFHIFFCYILLINEQIYKQRKKVGKTDLF